MNGRGWQPKNRDIISKGGCTKTGGRLPATNLHPFL